MDFFDLLALVGGLCLFLFGMNVMGQALERRAGSSLRTLLRTLTNGKFAGWLTGLGVTAVIQSSSATTVMVVGFVNSGIMTLSQAINVIMGANVGTTVTAWILSLGGIDGSNFFVQMLKPSNFTPILALVGIIFYMFCKSDKKKDTGSILLGFATLMFGMDTMSGAVSGLADVPQFQQLFIMFRNPVLGVLAGAVLTAIIQSSSASVGILQVLSATGKVSFAAAIPIIMGQNIGTCITAMLSSVGTNKNARRAAFVHLLFNIMGTILGLILFIFADTIFKPAIFDDPANELGIAVCHTAFNILCTVVLLPCSALLEKTACRLIPDDKKPEEVAELDERLLATPALALERSRMLAADMAKAANEALKGGLRCLTAYSPELSEQVKKMEEKTDHFEDVLGTYLVKLSSQSISEHDSAEAAGLLKMIGDFERIGDHATSLAAAGRELTEKELMFSIEAQKELAVICAAVSEVCDLACNAFSANNIETASVVESLEEVVDDLKDILRTRHIKRLQQGACSIEMGFVWADLLTNLERISDHCSNIAACVMDTAENNMNLHESVRSMKAGANDFAEHYSSYKKKYSLPD